MTPFPKRYRVAVSFAQDTKEYVRSVCEILAKELGRDVIFYYEYHVLERYNWKMLREVKDVYLKRSDLVVAVFSPGYRKSRWCRQELKAIDALNELGEHERILLCSFQDEKPRGVPSGPGIVELDGWSHGKTATLILRHLLDVPPKGEVTVAFKNVKPCHFDLNSFAEKCINAIKGKESGLVGLAFCCSSFGVLNRCVERLLLGLGRGSLRVGDLQVIDPKSKSIEKAVENILRLRNSTWGRNAKDVSGTIQDVLVPVRVENEEKARQFWSTLNLGLSGETRGRLIILLAVAADGAFPEGMTVLDTPKFQRGDAHSWIRGVVCAMQWPETFIDFWFGNMIREVESESNFIDPDRLYPYLEESLRFIEMNKTLSAFEAELKGREHV